MKPEDIRLEQTCFACPEQYDAYDEKDNEIAYLRLRHGYFYVECPYGGQEVYSANTIGDGLFDDAEREYHLTNAKRAIARFYTNMRGGAS